MAQVTAIEVEEFLAPMLWELGVGIVEVRVVPDEIGAAWFVIVTYDWGETRCISFDGTHISSLVRAAVWGIRDFEDVEREARAEDAARVSREKRDAAVLAWIARVAAGFKTALQIRKRLRIWTRT